MPKELHDCMPRETRASMNARPCMDVVGHTRSVTDRAPRKGGDPDRDRITCASMKRTWPMLIAALAACSHDLPPAATDPTPVTAASATASATAPSATASAAPTPIASAAPLPSTWERVPDIEYVPTPQNVVDK